MMMLADSRASELWSQTRQLVLSLQNHGRSVADPPIEAGRMRAPLRNPTQGERVPQYPCVASPDTTALSDAFKPSKAALPPDQAASSVSIASLVQKRAPKIRAQECSLSTFLHARVFLPSPVLMRERMFRAAECSSSISHSVRVFLHVPTLFTAQLAKTWLQWRTKLAPALIGRQRSQKQRPPRQERR